ncbi:hypothetical protein [Fodinicola acaciae]|uniref:hypothetical protein n=1 Tax=Fodinicola acaciae TaxID=2681555 RepID=UPI0013D75275|nr:hypothetical protein [Fodinicola acaciae]
MTTPGSDITSQPRKGELGQHAASAKSRLSALVGISDADERKSFREKAIDAGLKLALTYPARLLAGGTAFVSTGSKELIIGLGVATVMDVAVNRIRSKLKDRSAAKKKAEQIEKGLDPDKDPLEQLQDARQEIDGLREELSQTRADHKALQNRVTELAQKLSYTNQAATRADQKADASLDQLSAVRTSVQGLAAQQSQTVNDPHVRLMIQSAVEQSLAQNNETWQRQVAAWNGQIAAELQARDARINALEAAQAMPQYTPAQQPPPQQQAPPEQPAKQSWWDRVRGRSPEPAPAPAQQPQPQPEPRPVYPGTESQAGMPAPGWQQFRGAEPRPDSQQPQHQQQAPTLRQQGPLATPPSASKPGRGPKIS